jgi:acyl-CoA thioesterase I
MATSPAAKEAAQAPLYVAFGDSTAVGYAASEGSYVTRIHRRLAERWPAARLENLGENGASSSDVLARQVPRLRNMRPTLVTIAVGVNDVTRQVDPALFERNVEEIVRAARATSAHVLLANLPDAAQAPAVPSYLRDAISNVIARYNDRIAAIAARQDVVLIDLFTPSRKGLATHPEYFSSDGFHPSDAGHAYWADLMWPKVLRALDTERRKASASR